MAEGLRHAGIEVLRVLAAGALGLALAPWMGAPAWAAQPEVRWPAHFEVEARPGNKQTGFGGQAANFNGTTGTICVNGAPAP